MDELVDIWDANGKPTGEVGLKSEAHRLGLFHPTVHVWLYTMDGKILLQQRGTEKRTFPLYWDVSVAGHISAGETPTAAAIREVQEEIGIKIAPQQLVAIGVFKAVHHHDENFIDAEFHHTYLCQLNVSLGELKKQESEVENLALVSLLKFAEETWGLANLQKYVPHGAEYYKTVVNEIKARMEQ